MLSISDLLCFPFVVSLEVTHPGQSHPCSRQLDQANPTALGAHLLAGVLTSCQIFGHKVCPYAQCQGFGCFAARIVLSVPSER